MSISKKIRFEIFKRDKFTCQYCGRTAPDVVLQVDHIHPRSKGGDDDILNLVTSCFDCNQGKKARLLSDDAVIQKRKQQLDQLQERQEQLNMIMEWHRSLVGLDKQIIAQLSDFWSDLVPGYHLNEKGIKDLKKYIRRFGLNDVAEAMRISTEQYLRYNNNPDDPKPFHKSADEAWRKIGGICANKRKMQEQPYLKRLYYIRGILNNRLNYVDKHRVITVMTDAVKSGVTVNDIEGLAKEVRNQTQFCDVLAQWTEEAKPNGKETL